MNLLIIGNGFDLEHGLETTYSDFLSWAAVNHKMGVYNEFPLPYYWKMKERGKSRQDMLEEDRLYIPIFTERLFEKCNNWIDLENNVATIINSWGRSIDFVREKDAKTFKTILDDFLLPQFECYIADVINKSTISEKLPVTFARRVLSFNYSDTFERLYQPVTQAEICYINGKAVSNCETSNIVFGYDPIETTEDNKWYEYDKLFQRAYKPTGCQYKEWMKGEQDYNIHIFGHSLGQTDHAILRPFIMGEKNQTTVYYHSDESHKQLINRMMVMVGREFLDQHTIFFKDAKEFQMKDLSPRIEFL